MADGNGAKAPNVVQVSGDDGVSYVFSERQKVKKLSFITEDAVVTKFVFRNGAVREHTTPLANVEMIALLASHGADQKFGDEFSGLDDPEDAILAFEKLSTRLDQGPAGWSEKRESDGLAGTSLLVRALVKVTGQTPAEVKAVLDSMPVEDRKVLKKQSEVAAAIAEINAAKNQRLSAKGKLPDANEVLAKFKSVQPSA